SRSPVFRSHRDAADVAAAEEDLARRHTDHTPPREQALQARRRAAVGARIEQRHDDATGGDVEIDVAGCEALARDARAGALVAQDAGRLLRAHRERPGHRQAHHLEPPATAVTRRVEALPGIEGDRVLRIAPVILPGEAHDAGAHEAREIVDMAPG